MDQSLVDLMTEPTAAPADRLQRVKDAVVELRRLQYDKQDLEERLSGIQSHISRLESKELVDLLNEVGLPSVTVDAEGNMPAYTATKQPYYSAKIPEDRLEEAIEWFEDHGHGDLVKTTFTVSFGMREADEALGFRNYLEKSSIEYSVVSTVHSATLRAFVRNEIESGRSVPLDLLGAYVGQVVKIKDKKTR